MTAYMPKVGKLGLDMMYRTCTVQANLDFSSRSRHGQEAAGVAGAAAGGDRAVRQFAVHRRQAERLPVVPLGNLDATPTPTAPACCPGPSRTAWVSSAGSITRSTCRCISSSAATTISTWPGKSFRDFFAGKLDALPGERPTISDWANHLSTIFPEVRLKRYLEMRGADGGPWRRLPSLTAYWVGLLYDEDALDACWQMVKDWSAEERQKLRDDVPQARLQGRDRRPQRADAGAGDAAARQREASPAASASTATAATRRAICGRWRNRSAAASRRRRNCWRNTTASGTARSSRSTTSMRIDLSSLSPQCGERYRKITPPPARLPTDCRARR